MPRILLLRHGETDWNRNDRIQGWGDVSLNDRGRAQAEAAARYLVREHPDVDRLISSDLPRAVETAEAVTGTEHFEDVPVQLDEAWRERAFGVYQGREGASFFDEYPEFGVIENGRDAQTAVPEDGECYATFQDRVLDAWESLRRDANETVLVVTHCGPIRAVVADVRGMDVASAHTEVQPHNGSLTEIVVETSSTLDAVNRVDHLPTIT